MRCSSKEYSLFDRQLTDAGDANVDSGIVLVYTNDRFQKFRRRSCRVGIEVQHRATGVARVDGDGWGVVALAESELAARPVVLVEGNRSQRTNQNIAAKSSHVGAEPRESRDLTHRIEGDHGDGASSKMPSFIASSARERRRWVRLRRPSPLRRRHFLAVRHANVNGKVSVGAVFAALGKRTGSAREACLPRATGTRCGH
jgi:hypothetical protein